MTYDDDVCNTHDSGKNTGADDDLPEGHTERLLARGIFVEVTED